MLKDRKFIVLNQKGQPTHKLTEPRTYEEVEDERDLGILVEDPYVVLDFDDSNHFDRMVQIINAQHINTRIMKSDRGGHVWFKHKNPLKNNVDINTPITLKVDIRSYGKLSYVKVKTKGRWRTWLQDDEDVDDLPVWMTPVNHKHDFVGMKNTDGRNDALFAYIMTLTGKGLAKDDIRESLRIINEHIFDEPLSGEELDTIMRDESFDDLHPAFFDGTKFLHHVFGDYMISNDKIYVENNRLYMYDDGYYTQDSVKIESRMLEYIPNILNRQRQESMAYMLLKAETLPPTNEHMICCRNGTVNIRNGELLPNSATNFTKNKIDTIYDPEAYDENVDKVLDKISTKDDNLRCLLEEMMGYSLVPTSKFQKAFILYGGGANGKSTLLDMINEMIGSWNISSLSLNELNHNFKLSEITNRLINIGDDIADSYLKDTSIFKKLVTGDELTVDRKHEQPYKIRNYATMVFATNSLPQSGDKSDGFLRRLEIIPFNAKFKPTDPDYDPFILDKLTTENAKSYLLNLSIAGMMRVYHNNRFTKVEMVDDLLEEYNVDNNNVLQFLEEYDISDDTTDTAYSEYQFWASKGGTQPYKLRRFNKELRDTNKWETKVENRNGKSVQVWNRLL